MSTSTRDFAPTRARFMALAAEGATVIPVVTEILADDLTPVLACARVGGDVLLESVVGGEKQARFSFVGVDPAVLIDGNGDALWRRRQESEDKVELTKETAVGPFAVLRDELAQWTPPPHEIIVDEFGLPRFWGGAIGMVSYEAVRRFEPSVSRADRQDEGLQDDELAFGIGHTLCIFDNLRQTLRVVVPARIEGSAHAAYDRAIEQLERVVARLLDRDAGRMSTLPVPAKDFARPIPPASLSAAGFTAAIEKCQEHIRAGDIFQVVPSVRFEVDTDWLEGAEVDPFDVYRALRVVNPSPYMYYLRLPKRSIAGASPEALVRVEDGEATVRPIAGTYPRGNTREEDRQNEERMLADPKEIAEHVMLVDLGRNDLGRISKPGTVRIEDQMVVERYSHVMHLVSSVRGELEEGRDALDVLAATFPAGTLSGAPKVRAMQIIDEVEPVRRGVYAGAIGYLSFDGNADFAIAIRTVSAEDGVLIIQAGAGIVEASNPGREYDEVINKARAALVAVETARQAQKPS